MTNGCSPVAVGAFACKYADAVLEKHRCFSWADATDDLDAKDAKVEISRGAAAEPASRGAISQLQEYVQETTRFCMPPSCPVLHWDYDTRMSTTSLEFRATVAFLLDGVPHHSAGVWRPSKKLAQRDAAERALSLYASQLGDPPAAVGQRRRCGSPVSAGARAPHGHGAEARGAEAPAAPRGDPPAPPGSGAFAPGGGCGVEALRDFCGRLARHPAPPPEFSHRWGCDGKCQSFVQVELDGVSHTFSGQPCEGPAEADADVAWRVLWYLGCPGLEDAFELDPAHARAAAQAMPGPSSSWAKDGRAGSRADDMERELAERKTATMRLQNRLQRAFARRLEAGESVWQWSYERGGKDGKDRRWPPLYRATALVPLAGRSFVGGWARGQREAQLLACAPISAFLDAEFPDEPRALR